MCYFSCLWVMQCLLIHISKENICAVLFLLLESVLSCYFVHRVPCINTAWFHLLVFMTLCIKVNLELYSDKYNIKICH